MKNSFKVNVKLQNGQNIVWFVEANDPDEALDKMEYMRSKGHFDVFDVFQVERKDI